MELAIAVCDDLREERRTLAKMIHDCCRQRGIDASLRLFASGEELLSAVRRPGQFHVLFLDVYMPGLSGVETARRLRRIDRGCAVIFATTSTDHGLESFEVEASDYLVKPIRQENVDRAMDWFLEHVPKELRPLSVYAEREWMDIPLASILYIEVLGHHAHIHTGTRDVVARRGIDDLAAAIDSEDFLRCHRSYLVNLNYVRGIEGNDFRLTDGSLVPIRTGELAALRSQFVNWTYRKTWARV